MYALIIAFWMSGGQRAMAESACDSGCNAGLPWTISPQVEGDPLPTNARLLVLDESAPSVKDSAGAVVPTTTEPAPGGGIWLTATSGWTAGATYTLVSASSYTWEFTIGDSADTSPPTASGLTLTTWSFSTCDATIPIVAVVPEDLIDDQTTRGLFADVRVASASEGDALWANADEINVTIEAGDACYPGLAGVKNGDEITLEVRFYDLAGNASDPLSAGPTKLYEAHPDSGWSTSDDPKECGCAQGGTPPRALGALVGLLLLRRRATRREARP